MRYKLSVTRHARERMVQRGVTIERVEEAVNCPDIRLPGKSPAEMKFRDHEPPPPVGVVTSWPPSDDGRLKLVTCYRLNGER
ncbi:DUF4258 domain-containing protein [Ancrocorticia populi]|uniref:DUF4258 domain-containing protein n=1 Tax=Ancrocorticia populi TaxID=2175228 RepID=A0A2V1K8H5_9ACTO|nr:hypothetical protein DD236_06550 [Ancrocorticia populi]